MKRKPVISREQARADVQEAIDYYMSEAGADLAVGFVNALEQTFSLIAEMPAAGSPRWSHELNLAGLRSRGLKTFPWLVFYMEREDHIDVWRILHAARDFPAWMQSSAENP